MHLLIVRNRFFPHLSIVLPVKYLLNFDPLIPIPSEPEGLLSPAWKGMPLLLLVPLRYRTVYYWSLYKNFSVVVYIQGWLVLPHYPLRHGRSLVMGIWPSINAFVTGNLPLFLREPNFKSCASPKVKRKSLLPVEKDPVSRDKNTILTSKWGSVVPHWKLKIAHIINEYAECF